MAGHMTPEANAMLVQMLDEGASERGNTYIRCMGSDAVRLYVKLDEETVMIVEHDSDNYPSFHLRTMNMTQKQVAEHVQGYGGWALMKNNTGHEIRLDHGNIIYDYDV